MATMTSRVDMADANHQPQTLEFDQVSSDESVDNNSRAPETEKYGGNVNHSTSSINSTRSRRRKSTLKARARNDSRPEQPCGIDQDDQKQARGSISRRQTVTERNKQHFRDNDDYDRFSHASSSSHKLDSPLSSLHRTLSSGSSRSAKFSQSSHSHLDQSGGSSRGNSHPYRSPRLSHLDLPPLNTHSGQSHSQTLDHRSPSQSRQGRYLSDLSSLGMPKVSEAKNSRVVSAGLSLKDIASRTMLSSSGSPDPFTESRQTSVYDILNEIDIRDALSMIQGSGNAAPGNSKQLLLGETSKERNGHDALKGRESKDPLHDLAGLSQYSDQGNGDQSQHSMHAGQVAQQALDEDDEPAHAQRQSKKRRLFSFRRKKTSAKTASDRQSNAAEMASESPMLDERARNVKRTLATLGDKGDVNAEEEQMVSSQDSIAKSFAAEIENAKKVLEMSSTTATRARKVRTKIEDKYGYIYALLAGAEFSSPGAEKDTSRNPYNPLRAARARQDQYDLETMLRKSALERRVPGRRSAQHTAMNSVESFGDLQILNTNNPHYNTDSPRPRNVSGGDQSEKNMLSSSEGPDPQRLPFYKQPAPAAGSLRHSRAKSQMKARTPRHQSVATLAGLSVFEDQLDAKRSPWIVTVDDMRNAEKLSSTFYQTDSNQTDTSFPESLDQDSVLNKGASVQQTSSSTYNVSTFVDNEHRRRTSSPLPNQSGSEASPRPSAQAGQPGVLQKDMLDSSPFLRPGHDPHRRGSDISVLSDVSSTSALSGLSPSGSELDSAATGDHQRKRIQSIHWAHSKPVQKAHRHSRSAPTSGKQPSNKYREMLQKGAVTPPKINDTNGDKTDKFGHPAAQPPSGAESIDVNTREASQAAHELRLKQPGARPVKGVKGLFLGVGGLSSMHRNEAHRSKDTLSPFGEGTSFQEFTNVAMADGTVVDEGAPSSDDERLPLDGDGGGFIEGDFPYKTPQKDEKNLDDVPMKAVELVYVHNRALQLDEMINILNIFNPHIEHIHGVLSTQLGTCRDFMDRMRDMELAMPLSKDEEKLLQEAEDWSDQVRESDHHSIRSASPTTLSNSASARDLTQSAAGTRPQTARSDADVQSEQGGRLPGHVELKDLRFLENGGHTDNSEQNGNGLRARRLAKASYKNSLLAVPLSVPLQRSLSTPGRPMANSTPSPSGSESPRKGSLSPSLLPPSFDRRLLSESMPLSEPSSGPTPGNAQGVLSLSALDALNLDPGQSRLRKVEKDLQMQDEVQKMKLLPPSFISEESSQTPSIEKGQWDLNDQSSRLARAYRNTRQVTMPFSKMSSFELGRSNIEASVRDMGRAQGYMEKMLQDLKALQESSGEQIKKLASEIDTIQNGINEGTYQNLKSLEDYFVKMQRSGSRSSASAALSLINGNGSLGAAGVGGSNTLVHGFTGWLIDVGFGILSYLVVAILWLIWFIVGLAKIVTWPIRLVFRMIQYVFTLALVL